MGFKNGAYAKIWKIEDKGNYHVANISTSKKNKETDTYETDFSSNIVRFIGTAHKQAANIKDGDRVKIDSCEVTNKYDKEKKKEYVNFIVYALGDMNADNTNTDKPSAVLENNTNTDDDCPF